MWTEQPLEERWLEKRWKEKQEGEGLVVYDARQVRLRQIAASASAPGTVTHFTVLINLTPRVPATPAQKGD